MREPFRQTLVRFIVIGIFALLMGCGDNLPTAQEKLRSAESSLVRASAAERLGVLGGEEAIRSLTLYGLRDASPSVRAASARALAGKNHPQVIDLFGDLLLDRCDDVRRAAAEGLARARGEKASRYLELGYMRSGSGGRAIISESILKAGGSPRRVIEDVASRRMQRALAALESGVVAERVGALHELGASARPQAVTILLEHLEHNSVPVAAAAAAGLGIAGDKRAVPALIAALREPYPALRRASLEALAALDAVAATEAVLGLALDDRIQVASDAVATLALFSPNEEVASALCRVARETKEPQVVSTALLALRGHSALDGCDLEDLLVSRLRDQDSVRLGLAILQGGGESLSGQEVIDELMELLSSPDVSLRTRAIEASLVLGARDLGATVLEMLREQKTSDELAREKWIATLLPPRFGWGEDGSAASSEHDPTHHQHDLAELFGGKRHQDQHRELMDRLASYRADMENRRRIGRGLDEGDHDELVVVHRAALSGDEPTTRAALLPGVPPAKTGLLAALAQAAAELVGEESFGLVGALLHHPETTVRVAAATGLAASDSALAARLLEGAFDEAQSAEVLTVIARALSSREMGGEAILNALTWTSPGAMRAVVAGLENVRGEETLRLLVGLLDRPFSADVVRVLLHSDGQVAATALTRHLETADAPGAPQVLDAGSTSIPTADLTRAAKRALHSEWPDLRRAGAVFLRRNGVTDPWLEALRADFDGRVRAAADSASRQTEHG